MSADLFGFNMMVYGIHSDLLLEEEMNNEDIEVYGVNWEGLNDDQVLCSRRENNSTDEGSTSWIGQTGPPQNLNKVPVYPLSSDELTGLAKTVCLWYDCQGDENRLLVWSHGLGYAKAQWGNVF